jgi:hypothetical protein
LEQESVRVAHYDASNYDVARLKIMSHDDSLNSHLEVIMQDRPPPALLDARILNSRPTVAPPTRTTTSSPFIMHYAIHEGNNASLLNATLTLNDISSGDSLGAGRDEALAQIEIVVLATIFALVSGPSPQHSPFPLLAKVVRRNRITNIINK